MNALVVYGLDVGPVVINSEDYTLFKDEKETQLLTATIANKKYFIRIDKEYPDIGFLIRPEVLSWSIIEKGENND